MMYIPSIDDDLSKSCILLREAIKAHGGLQRWLPVQDFVIRAKQEELLFRSDSRFNSVTLINRALRHMFSFAEYTISEKQ